MKQALEVRDGGSADRFANTRDTLCYATLDNQTATSGALDALAGKADLAVVVGGYNSSNTSHLVELCEEVMPTWFVRGADEFAESGRLGHFDLHAGERKESGDWWPESTREPGVTTVLLTSGASCPDSAVDRVLQKILERAGGGRAVDDVLQQFEQEQANLGSA